MAESFAGPGTAIAGGEVTVLFRVLSADTRLAIWQRHPPPAWSRLMKPLRSVGPFRVAAEGEPDTAVRRLDAALPAPPVTMMHDVHLLAGLFAVISRQATVRIRLEGVTCGACTRWHVDTVPLRLLCTHHGPGTEWPAGDDEAAVPGEIGSPCVALLKGRGFPGKPDDGCLHRSPALSRRRVAQRSRLLICVDLPGYFPSCDPS
jgi:hypothetical protein